MIASRNQMKHLKKMVSPSKAIRSRNETAILLRKLKLEDEKKRRRGMKKGLSTFPTSAAIELNIPNNKTDPLSDNDNSDDDRDCATNSKTVAGKKMRLLSDDETIKLYSTRLRELTYHIGILPIPFDEKLNESTADIIQGIRRLLSERVDPPISKLLELGLLPSLTSVIQVFNRFPKVLHESLWCLVNVSSSNVPSHIKALEYSGVVPHVVNLLQHANADVCEQALWFVANIAGDNEEYRDGLLNMPQVIQGILFNSEHPKNASVLINCGFAISNLFRGQHQSIDNVLPIAIQFIPHLVKKLKGGISGHTKASHLVDLMKAVLTIVDLSSKTYAIIMETDFISTLAHVLHHYSEEREAKNLLLSVIRLFGLFASGSDEQTDKVLQSGFLQYALTLLKGPSKLYIQRDVLYALSNIAAGTHMQINQLFKQTGLIQEIIHLANDGHAVIKKEALWTLCNIVTEGTLKNIESLVIRGCIPTFSRYLASPYDDKIVLIVLEACEKILQQNKLTDMDYISDFESCDCVRHFEDLQSSQNDKIYDAAVRIIVEYFNGVEAEPDENLVPLKSIDETTFEFGIATKHHPTELPAKQLFPDNVDMFDAIPTTDLCNINLTAASATPLYNFGGNINMNTYL